MVHTSAQCSEMYFRIRKIAIDFIKGKHSDQEQQTLEARRNPAFNEIIGISCSHDKLLLI
jgi:hypothetical protein